MLFSMSTSRLRRLFHICDDFHDFGFVSFCSAGLAFFKIFFPSVPPPYCGLCAFLCGDRGRSLFIVPRGGLSLGPQHPRFSHSRPTQRFHHPRLGSFPHFKRPPTTPSVVPHDPATRTQSQLRIKSEKPRCRIFESEDARRAVTN